MRPGGPPPTSSPGRQLDLPCTWAGGSRGRALGPESSVRTAEARSAPRLPELGLPRNSSREGARGLAAEVGRWSLGLGAELVGGAGGQNGWRIGGSGRKMAVLTPDQGSVQVVQVGGSIQLEQPLEMGSLIINGLRVLFKLFKRFK